MAAQADLFTPAIQPPQAPEGRAGPRLWVRRLAIFRDPQTIIRDVSLKPGLNIIWTPDMSSSGSRALAHGSGKTTFCRLLRACLGEPGYATDTQRSRLMARLPNGLFAAEILIDGVCWVAIRAAQAAAKAVPDRVYRARRTLEDVRSLRDGQAAATPTPPAIAELEAARAQLDAGRARARAAIRTLEERYQGVMAAWLPEGVQGSIKLDGNGLRVDAEFSGRGEVSTAALDSLKIVAFDLAALHMAVEERADLPAFLIHDSPREADLDGQLYARLFSLVHQWEEGVEAPCFQYIVTTTTAPPSELQGDRYVRLVMSSTPAERRLLAMDI